VWIFQEIAAAGGGIHGMPEISPTKLSGSGYRSIKPLPQNNPKQAGPNCGLYALSYVMRHWHEKLKDTPDAIAQPLPARSVDLEVAVKLPKSDPNKVESLRHIAKHANSTHPMTFLGELFSGEALVTVAKKAGFDAKIHTPASKDYIATLFTLVDANHPAIVSLDVDQDIHTVAGGKKVTGPNNGCPGKFGGEHAHWAVIVAYEKGFFWDDVVMFHWEKYFQFWAGDLRDSSNQLVRFSGQSWYKIKDPTEQGYYDAKGNRLMMFDVSKPIDLKTGKHPIIPSQTPRGGHWQKLESENLPRDTGAPGTTSWKGKDQEPGDYAKTAVNTPTFLTNKVHGQVVKTVFGNTNLNLRNVIVEVVPQGAAFAK
jgi:hypothetical protein